MSTLHGPRPRRPTMTTPMSKARLEAFSDGVLAVAITLLALNLHADATARTSLAVQVRHDWPSFAAFALSFFVIGVIWVNHHALFALASRVDRSLLFYNTLLLMWVTTIPFTTATLASYLRSGGTNTHIAVLLYGASSEGMAISFTLILRHLVRHQLLLQPVSVSEGRTALRRFGVGVVLYPAVTAIGLLSPMAMLLLYAVLTGYYILERTPVLPTNPEPPEPGSPFRTRRLGAGTYPAHP
jgi:uncharacterized membrane protein